MYYSSAFSSSPFNASIGYGFIVLLYVLVVRYYTQPLRYTFGDAKKLGHATAANLSCALSWSHMLTYLRSCRRLFTARQQSLLCRALY